MRVSQLIHAMDRDDEIIIDDFGSRIDCMRIYRGAVKGIKKDNPINKMHIMSVCVAEDSICVLAIKPKKGAEDEKN